MSPAKPFNESGGALSLPNDLRWLEDPREILQALTPPPPTPPNPALQPIRLRHAWRLARAKSILNAWIEPNEPLSYLAQKAHLNFTPEDDIPAVYWRTLPQGARTLTYTNHASLTAEITEHDLPDLYIPPGQYATDAELRRALTRQAILPSPEHTWYEHAPERWQSATMLIAERLHLSDAFKVEDSSTGNLMTDSTSAAEALQELLNNPDSWPTPEEILDYEDHITDFAMSLLVQRGRVKTDNFFLTCFKLTRPEATLLIGFARAKARDLTAGDIEEKRAMMELMLDDLLQRCKTAHDLKAELGTLKAMSIVQGIARAEIEDDGDIFARIAKKSSNHIIDVTATSERQLNPPPPTDDDGDN